MCSRMVSLFHHTSPLNTQMVTILTQCTSKWKSFSDVRSKQRAVVEFLTVEKVPPIEIHRRMQAVYGDQCVDEEVKSAVRKWFQKQNNFFKGRISKTSAVLAEVY